MVIIREADAELYQERKIQSKTGQIQYVKRQSSAKEAGTASSDKQALSTQDKPNDRSQTRHRKHTKKHSDTGDPLLDEFKYHRDRLTYSRYQKALFKNMKDSIESLTILTNGLANHVVQVRKQQGHAKRIWADIENHLLKVTDALTDDKKGAGTPNPHESRFREPGTPHPHESRSREPGTPYPHESRSREPGTPHESMSMSVRADTPAKLVLPTIYPSATDKGSRPGSLPSVFKDIDSPGPRESEVFNADKTNHIKKVARKRSKEKSVKAEDLFPMVTESMGMPRLQLKAKRKDADIKKTTLIGEMEARQRIQKRLFALETFQEKYIVNTNKGLPNTGLRSTGPQNWGTCSDITENMPNRQHRELNKK